MSYYRNVYLKSEDWKSLRKEVLIRDRYACQICGKRSSSNDAHHLRYGKLFDVTPSDLKTLCRNCHEKAHAILKKYPKLSKLPNEKQWLVLRQRMGLKDKNQNKDIQSKLRIFGKMRDFLAVNKIAKRDKMVFSTAIITSDFIPIRKHPMKYLSQYIKATGIDPRYKSERGKPCVGLQRLPG